MVDDELAPPCEDLAERPPTLLALERVLLLDQLPRQFATLFAQLIAKAGELLFFGQMLLSGRHPLVVRHYLVNSHLVLLGLCTSLQADREPQANQYCAWGSGMFGSQSAVT